MRIDLNADVGEGYDDLSLLPYLTSINVACGGHAGDERTMTELVRAAGHAHLAIGAHPSYPDREHFGRRDLELAEAEIEASIVEQIRALVQVAAQAGARLTHVKPHGALYNAAARDRGIALAVARAVHAVDVGLRVVGLAGSVLIDVARSLGLSAAAEGFADRRYAADGSLAPRSLPGAVIHDPAEAAEQAVGIAGGNAIAAIDGTPLVIRADTLCLHGDTDGAVAIARAIRRRLTAAGVELAPL